MNSLRALGIAIAIAGTPLVSGLAGADSFNERFAAATPQDTAVEQWGIKLLLIVNGKIIRAVDYSTEVYSSGEACKGAILADTNLQAAAQAETAEFAKSLDPTASVGIACTMRLD